MQLSTGRLTVPGFTNKHAYMSRNKAKNIDDPRSLPIKTTSSCEVFQASMPRKIVGNQESGRAIWPGCTCI